jgi:hypothetical protein
MKENHTPLIVENQGNRTDELGVSGHRGHRQIKTIPSDFIFTLAVRKHSSTNKDFYPDFFCDALTARFISNGRRNIKEHM